MSCSKTQILPYDEIISYFKNEIKMIVKLRNFWNYQKLFLRIQQVLDQVTDTDVLHRVTNYNWYTLILHSYWDSIAVSTYCKRLLEKSLTPISDSINKSTRQNGNIALEWIEEVPGERESNTHTHTHTMWLVMKIAKSSV